eukprot:9297296-Alexandrium_andersonii.AAC.1
MVVWGRGTAGRMHTVHASDKIEAAVRRASLGQITLRTGTQCSASRDLRVALLAGPAVDVHAYEAMR